MKGAYFCLGSNLDDRKANLHAAAELMSTLLGELSGISRIYESEAWGYQSSNAYLNFCLGIRTALPAKELLAGALEIEQRLGRVRKGEGYTDRIIDIDLLLFGDLVLDEEGLVLPHPRMHLRRFVLQPLEEIAGGILHPVLGRSIHELLLGCTDSSDLSLFEESNRR